MANNRRGAGTRGSVATANRPRPQPNQNPAIEPQAAVAQIDEVIVHTADFQIDPDDGDEGTGSIQELPDLDADADGVVPFNDGSPIFDLNGEVQELERYDGGDAVDTGPRTDEISFVGAATDDMDDDDLDDGGPSEEMIAAQRLMAEAQDMQRRAQATLEEAQRVAQRKPAGVLQRLRGNDVVVAQAEPTIVEPPAKFRVLRTNEEVGPVFYGSEEIHLLKGRRYRVPEHIYVYLAERDLIHSMG